MQLYLAKVDDFRLQLTFAACVRLLLVLEHMILERVQRPHPVAAGKVRLHLAVDLLKH